MDMSTMWKKLDAGEYPDTTKFFEDFKLMIRNCFVFNPSNTPVNQAGIDLQRLFDEKWKHLPPLQDAGDDEDEEYEDEEYEDEEYEDEERNRTCTSRIQYDHPLSSNIGLLAILTGD
jgi:bromodomain-containing factor 1